MRDESGYPGEMIGPISPLFVSGSKYKLCYNLSLNLKMKDYIQYILETFFFFFWSFDLYCFYVPTT